MDSFSESGQLGDAFASSTANAKGFGSMANLAVQAVSDFAFADTINAVTNVMRLSSSSLLSLKLPWVDATPDFMKNISGLIKELATGVLTCDLSALQLSIEFEGVSA